MLTLAEKLLLIGLNDETGKIHFNASTALPFALSGAVLAELMLLGKVEKKDKMIVIIDGEPTGHPIFDKALSIMKNTPRKRNAKYWVQRLRRDMKELRQDLLVSLIGLGILKEEKRKILGLFESKRYPAVDGEIEEKMKERLRLIVQQPTETLQNLELEQERTLVLLSLVNVCNLLGQVFERQEARVVRKQLKHLTKDLPISDAVKKIVDSINASVIAAVSASAAASAAAASSSG